jgi:hypothetical protein
MNKPVINPWVITLIGALISLGIFAATAFVLSVLIAFVTGAAFGFLKAAALIVIIAIVGAVMRSSSR